MNVKLRDIISTYLDSRGLKTMEDTDKSMEKQGEETANLLAWDKLQNVLETNYDIPMHFVEKFQQFRFYCVLNHLEIGDNFMSKIMANFK